MNVMNINKSNPVPTDSKALIFSTSDVSKHLWKNVKKKNLNFVYTLHHIAVSKTTLACTAANSANTHTECFVLVNLDQPVTKQATAI